MSLIRIVMIAALAAAALAPGASAQEGAPDIIRGRVLGPDSIPVQNATVSAMSMANQTSRASRTDENGRYTIIFADGGGDYLITFTMIGLQPVRFEVKATGDEAVLVADAQMLRTPQLLDAVRVAAQRQRPGRDNEPDIGGSERTIGDNVPVDKLGDLAEMAASLPGVSLIPSVDGSVAGFSVLGLGGEQNSVTLNGLTFEGGDLPRDATMSSRVSTTTFDVSRGGFSGAQMSIRTRGGSNYRQRSLHVTLDEPHLQWTDRTGTELGQQFTNLQLSGTASGPIAMDKSFYNVSFQAGRRSSDLQTLLNTDPLTLERVGVSSDSVARLLSYLGTSGIPATMGRIPDNRFNDNGSVLARLDFAPTGTHSMNFTINGRWRRSQAAMLSSTSIPTHGGENSSYGGTIQANHSSYFGSGILSDTRASVSVSESDADGYLTLPDGRVLVSSGFNSGGSGGVSTLQFGGNSSLPRTSTNTNYQVVQAFSWITNDNKHRFRLTGDLQMSRYSEDQTSNQLGTFTFNSLADLEAGRPESFSRRLSPNLRTGDMLSTAFSLGDAWRMSPALQVQYGVRVEANRYGASPTRNPLVEQTFGIRNDLVPNEIHVSPSLGFQWNYGRAREILGFRGAARSPRAQLRGGIREFRNGGNSRLISTAIDNTGLPDAAQRLSCVGDAAPVPDWAAYEQGTGSIPEVCADGTMGSVFASSLPNVVLFDPAYESQRSWRSNLAWSGPVLNNRFRSTIEGTLSLNMDQDGTVDANFDRQTRFTLPDEANRPVYVDTSSIFASTGSIASRDARISQDFAQVRVERSDLRSMSRQISVSLAPVSFNSRLRWNITYVFQTVRELTRGFDGNTAGDPLLTEWARGSRDSRHQFNYSLSRTMFSDAVNMSIFGRVSSGSPYTPMVRGDINGDGYSNDRAFVADPAATQDPSLAAAMESLLANSPASVRDCLRSQMGRIASRNSCEGPWTASMNMRIGLNSDRLKLPTRSTISLSISNPLTAIDALVHGPNNLKGWGQRPSIDPTLLYVRGFDSANQRFVYEVNPRFGDPRPINNGVRSPFQITLDVRMNVGPEMQKQQFELALRQGRGGRGNKLNERQLMRRFASGINPFDMMLRQRDSLHLTEVQLDSLASIQKQYTTALDSIWTPVVKYLAALGDKYDEDAAYDRVREAQNSQFDVLSYLGPKAKGTLTAEQLRMLPDFIAVALDSRAIQTMRPGRRFGPGGE